ncbi:MAG: hypothetical protein JO053_11695 [Acidobacteria bacterium]|nr:hypothetical protein [Acidobacteriota bacterium]
MPDHLQQAIAYGEQSLSSGIMVPEVLLEMADIQYDVGDPTKAFGLLDQAARIQGYASDATFRKGRILFMMGRYSDAKLCFQQVRPDELNGERVYAEAQMSLKDAAVYERLPRAHVQSKF